VEERGRSDNLESEARVWNQTMCVEGLGSFRRKSILECDRVQHTGDDRAYARGVEARNCGPGRCLNLKNP
jgi:hypothetical protein